MDENLKYYDYICSKINAHYKKERDNSMKMIYEDFDEYMCEKIKKAYDYSDEKKPSYMYSGLSNSNDEYNMAENVKFVFGDELKPCSSGVVYVSSINRGKYEIETIYHNPEKATTVVEFYTKSKIKVKKDSEDPEDIYMAVASAVMIRYYGSNSAFKAHIRKMLPSGFHGRPQVYQIMAAAKVGDIYGSWEKFCKIVDNKIDFMTGKEIDKLRKKGVSEKEIVAKLKLKGVTELRKLRASYVKSNNEK